MKNLLSNFFSLSTSAFQFSSWSIRVRRALATATAALGVIVLLPGCLLANMEKITEETRDEVRATNDAIHAQEEMVKIAGMRDIMLNPELSKSARANAAKAVLAKYPETQLAGDMGLLAASFRMGSVRRVVAGAEIEFLNVPYVSDKKTSTVLGVAGLSTDLFDIFSIAAIQLTSEVEARSKSAGITAEDMANYRTIAKRLAVIVPALLGAVALEPMEQSLQGFLAANAAGSLEPGTFAEQMQNTTRSGKRLVPATIASPLLSKLEQLAVNTGLDESDLSEMRALISIRLGIN